MSCGDLSRVCFRAANPGMGSSIVIYDISSATSCWQPAIISPQTQMMTFFYFYSKTRPTSYFPVEFPLFTVMCLLYIIRTRKIKISPTFRFLIHCSMIFPGSPTVRICSLTKAYMWLDKSVLVLSKMIQMRLIAAGLARQATFLSDWDKRTASECLQSCRRSWRGWSPGDTHNNHPD